MERNLEVRTGESIVIRYELAGLGSRFLAVALDIAIQVAITIGLLVVLAGIAVPLTAAAGSVPTPRGANKTAQAILGAIGVFAIFVLYFGYFIGFERWWSGRTPGKRMLGIRVVRDAGFPIDTGAAVIRNLVRVLEFGLGFYTLSAIAALLSPENKRLGDIAAGTIVVRDRPDETIALRTYMARDVPADDGLTAAERSLIERYVARRDQLEDGARTRLAAQLAQRVRPLLRASFDHLNDDELLGHLGRGGGSNSSSRPHPDSCR